MNESMCTVTLTNWKRLSNAPIDLSKCFAVQWRREFIAVSEPGGTTLLYNVKWNMWSQLAKLPDGKKPCQGCPLTCYDEKLLILTQGGEMYELIPEKNQWRENETLTPSDQFGRYLDTAVLAASTESETMLFVTYRQSYRSSDTLLQGFDGSSWSEPVSLQLDVLRNHSEQKHISIAIQKTTIYINNEDIVYSIYVPTDKRAPIMQPEETAQAHSDSPNGESKAVAQNVPSSLTPVDVMPRKRRNEDHNLNLGTLVKIPKLDTYTIDLENVVTTKINSVPSMKSPLCAVGGYLFAFGGRDEDKQPFSSVYRFIEETNTWKEAGYMTTARYGAALAIFDRKDEDLVDVFVIGGYLGENSKMKLGCCIADKCEVSITTH